MEAVELALDLGADIEAKDIEGWTPLMRGGWWKWKKKCPFNTETSIHLNPCVK
jgi:hypothetical protein